MSNHRKPYATVSKQAVLPFDKELSLDNDRARQRLQQEQVTFDQRQTQEAQWFKLRLTMGYSSILIMGAIMVIATYILVSGRFSGEVVTGASGVLFVDVLGLIMNVWRIAHNPKSIARLIPVTKEPVRTEKEKNRDDEIPPYPEERLLLRAASRPRPARRAGSCPGGPPRRS